MINFSKSGSTWTEHISFFTSYGVVLLHEGFFPEENRRETLKLI